MDNALNEYSHAQRGDGILRRMNVYAPCAERM